MLTQQFYHLLRLLILLQTSRLFPLILKHLHLQKFFHLGKDNKWETFLERDEADEIENAFRDEMKELKYL